MKGIILDFSIQTNTGIISGDDSTRYHFLGNEWKETVAPQRGMKVDFDLNAQGQAIGVYKALIGSTSSAPNTFTSTEDKSEEQYNLFDWFFKCLKNYANFSGRARRKEFWFFYLGTVIINFIAMILDRVLETEVIFYGLVNLGLLVPTLAVSARRLHDVGRSGWWSLISLTIIGFIPLVVWWTQEGPSHNNMYGEPAK
ncbi:DUF805 domain-containing protein [Acinetobacter ursingii]|uniref:DUF805 domain-containing protein n=1 Tax=Acinetobacter ursingii TaxID=108980 RepID=A0AA46NNF1_9GAMM|nr:DUF805 domain-containing protein [Acinetobacter ursingii]UYF70939.1 DUF805 domain-containing protein [Acinetobacter ursingii]